MSEKRPESLHELPRGRIFIIFGGVLGGVFLGTLDQTIVATALPDIIAQLGGFQRYTFVATAYLIATVVMVPITGRMTDIFGRKWFYIAGISVFVLGSALSGQSHSLNELIAFRAFQGIGAGMMIANAFAVIGDLFTPAERGKYQAYVSIIFGLSSIIGPLVGGALTDTVGWPWIFYINVPTGIGVIVLFLFTFPDIKPEKKTGGIDYPGLSLLIASVVPFLLALSWGGVQYPWLSAEIIGLFVFSLAMTAAFIWVEGHTDSPIIPLKLFRGRVIPPAVAVTFLTGFAMFGGIIFVPLYFQGVLGRSATSSGNSLTPMMVAAVIGAFASGQGLSRWGGHYRLHGLVGLPILAGGMWLLTTLTVSTSDVRAILYLLMAGFGLGITLPIYAVAVQNVAPREIMGAAISAVPFWRFMGGAFGLAILGSLLASRFASEFLARLPSAATSLISQAELNSLAHNPHLLVSSQAQERLKETLASLGPEGEKIYQEVLNALHQALDTSLTYLFLIVFGISLAALAVQLFVKEVPLRREH